MTAKERLPEPKNPLGIDGGRDRSEAAVDVQVVGDARIIAAPDRLAVGGVNAQHVSHR